MVAHVGEAGHMRSSEETISSVADRGAHDSEPPPCAGVHK